MPGGVSISGCIRALADDRQNGSDELDRRHATAKASHEVPAGRAGGSAETQGWAVGVEFGGGVGDWHGVAGGGCGVGSEAKGWGVGVEFVGTVVVSALIGVLLAKVMCTGPWLMIVFRLLGFAAGFRRAMKTSKQFDTDPTNDNE